MSKDVGEQGREKDCLAGPCHIHLFSTTFILNSVTLKFGALSLLVLFLITKWIDFHDSDNFYVSIHLQGEFTSDVFQTNHFDCLNNCSSEVIL